MSDPLPSPEGNRGATPTWDPSFSYRLRTETWTTSEQPVGEGELYRDRSIGRILRSPSRKCQRTISVRRPRKVLRQQHLSRTVTALTTTAYSLLGQTPICAVDMDTIRLASDQAGLSLLPCSASRLRQPRRSTSRDALERSRRPARNTTSKPAAAFWFPTADIVVASAGGGTLADLAGIADRRQARPRADRSTVPDARSCSSARRAATSSGFSTSRSNYTQTTTLNQDIVFNGIRYSARACR